MDYEKELYELCETIKEEIGEANEKIKKAGGKLSGSDVEYIDKLTHSLKSIKAVMAMMEDEGEDEYSGASYARGGNRGGRSYRGGSYRGGNSYDDGMTGGSYEQGGSYARDGRGRGSNARRDSMGRYSSRMDGYSRHGDVIESLREVMEEAPDDRTRTEIQRLIEKMEQR
jgi:hypothetical protein